MEDTNIVDQLVTRIGVEKGLLRLTASSIIFAIFIRIYSTLFPGRFHVLKPQFIVFTCKPQIGYITFSGSRNVHAILKANNEVV